MGDQDIASFKPILDRIDNLEDAVKSMLETFKHKASRTEILFLETGQNGKRILSFFEHDIQIPIVGEEVFAQKRLSDGTSIVINMKVTNVKRRFYDRPFLGPGKSQPSGHSIIVIGDTISNRPSDRDWDEFEKLIDQADRKNS